MVTAQQRYPGPTEQTLRERLATLERREAAVAAVMPSLLAIQRLASAALTDGTEEAGQPIQALRCIRLLADRATEVA